MESDNSKHNKGILIGHGIDAVDIDDFSRLMHLSSGDFIDRHFTESELKDVGTDARRIERLAGRFAIKEAVMKALGVGWGGGIAFTDIEVRTLPSGAPFISLQRKLREVEITKSIRGWHVTCSHTSKIAVASAIAVGG